MATAADDLPRPLGTALTDAVVAVGGLFGAQACSVAVADLDAGVLRYVASHGRGERAIVGVTVPLQRGIAGWVVTSGQPIAVADVESDRRFARDVAEATGYVPRTILAAPVVGDDEPLGVVSVLDPGRRERELDLLGTLGVLLAGTLNQTRAASGELAGAVAAVSDLGRDAEDLATALLTVVAERGRRRSR